MNYITHFTQPKHGQGCSVTAANYAIVNAQHHHTVLIDASSVDGQSDLPSILGIPEPSAPFDPVDVYDDGRLIFHSMIPSDLATRYIDSKIIIDYGTLTPHRFSPKADRTIGVVRACYVTLRRAVAMHYAADELILITEVGRALNTRDVERALGITVSCELPWDPAIARVVDAGLLSSRLPFVINQAMDPLLLPVVERIDHPSMST